MTFNPIQSIDKTLVAKRFAHARNTYGREARVQQQVAEKDASPADGAHRKALRRTKQYRQHTKLS